MTAPITRRVATVELTHALMNGQEKKTTHDIMVRICSPACLVYAVALGLDCVQGLNRNKVETSWQQQLFLHIWSFHFLPLKTV